jgi:hypothetical protein
LSERGPRVRGWPAVVLCIHDFATGSEREIHLPGVTLPPIHQNRSLDASGPRWIQNDRGILLAGFDPHAKLGIYRVDVATGKFEAWIEPGTRVRPRSPWLSRDGHTLFYVHGPKRAARLVARDRRSRQERTLHEGPIRRTALSPDEDSFAIAELDRLLLLPKGGTARTLYVSRDRVLRNAPLAWLPDGSAFVFREQNGLELCTVAGQVSPIGARGAEWPTLRSDGLALAWTAWHRGGRVANGVWAIHGLVQELDRK